MTVALTDSGPFKAEGSSGPCIAFLNDESLEHLN
jgi:hypothetical protein